MWPSSSVPTEGSKWNRRWKLPEPQGFPALFQAKNTNVPIPGYLFSMMIEQDGTQRREKPVWQIDVCAALPDSRVYSKGGTTK